MDKRVFNKNYILVLLAAALFYISSFMLNSVRGKYCVDTGRPQVICGMVVGVFTLASAVSRPLWAYFTDKSGRKIIIYTGLVLCFAASVMLVFNDDIIFLLVSRFVFGRGYSAITTAAGTVVCDVSQPGLLPKAISFYGITNVLSQAIAPSVALWLYRGGFIWVCIAVAAIIAGCFFIMLFVKYSENKFLDPDNRFAVVEKSALPAAFTIFFFAVAVASVYSYVPVMAQQRNIPAPGLFFTVSALALLAGRLFNTKIACKITVNKTFYMGCAGLVAGFVVMAVSANIFVLCISAVFYGFGAGIVHPVINTAAVKNCKPADRGLATGTFMMSQDFGMTTGALIRGAVSGAAGFAAVYFISAALSFFMVPVYNKLLKAENKK